MAHVSSGPYIEALSATAETELYVCKMVSAVLKPILTTEKLLNIKRTGMMLGSSSVNREASPNRRLVLRVEGLPPLHCHVHATRASGLLYSR